MFDTVLNISSKPWIWEGGGSLFTLDINMATDFWSAGHTYDHMESQI